MLDKFLENYTNELFEKQNFNMDKEQQNLFSKQDYYELLKPVIETVNNHKDYTLEELRKELYEKSKIEEKVKSFINKREMVPGMVFSYGTKNYQETVVIGNRQEVSIDESGRLIPSVENMTDDTIFDLASITKLFTSLSILKLVEKNEIDLNYPITYYAPQFKNLDNVTVFDLLSFNKPLKTNGRVDRVNTQEEAEKILFDIEVDLENNNRRPYTDMGAMVLKYVIESVTKMNYYEFIDNFIISKLELKDTHVSIPKSKIDRVASTNFDGKYYKDGNFSINTTTEKGIVYDPKAQIMNQKNGNLSGHAGLFSTSEDMTNLAKGMIGGKVIDAEYIRNMSKNRTGKLFNVKESGEKEYIQYLGFLCYSKNPILSDSELFHALSGRSIASAGWTGTQLTVDPINELFFFMGSNRSHNRMTYIDPAQRDKVKIDENGKKTIILPNGDIKIDSTRFAWDRDTEVVHPAIKLAIQYQMLESIYNIEREMQPSETVKYI